VWVYKCVNPHIVRSIEFYRTESGKCPIEEFIDSLNGKQAQKVNWVLGAIRSLPMVPPEYLKKLSGTEDIWEVRSQFGGDAFRLLGFWREGNLIVLTNGFAKKTDRVPQSEIDLATQRKHDYIRRMKKNG
jgi:phage-related protein